jgi:hypothetical protein
MRLMRAVTGVASKRNMPAVGNCCGWPGQGQGGQLAWHPVIHTGRGQNAQPGGTGQR